MSQTYAIVTYGCQMNDHDSELMAGLFASRGMTKVDDERQADLVVFNTCCVREGAEQRALSRMEALLSAKAERPSMVVALAGCVAQEQKGRLLDAYPNLDIVVGTRDYPRLADMAEQVRATGDRMVAVDSVDTPLVMDIRPLRADRLRARVNIMYGCNNTCTFCIVPTTRGREWSRPLPEVVREVEALVADGCREVQLLGQNVNSYRDGEKRDFADLLRALDAIDGLWRIRYMSPNPKDARERHISAISQCGKVMEQLHLPVQSGSDRILRLMKRSYSVRRYRQLVERYRAENPLSSLTTDVIVGFPGETEEDFLQTMALMEEIRFDQAFMFHYSPRPGTVSATTMTDDVPRTVKLERLRRLIAMQERITREINEAQAGIVHEVLVDGHARKGGGLLRGRSRTDKTVLFEGPERLMGTLAHVRITEARGHSLYGELVAS
jgi:tRNA-2-methylthio-N6-dimethylallyladenosine synthase